MRPTLDEISNFMNIYLGYDFRDTKGRKRENVYIRRVFYKLANRFSISSNNDLGKYLKQDRTTVIAALNNFKEIELYEPKILEFYNEIYYILSSYKKNPIKEVIDVNILTYGIKTN